MNDFVINIFYNITYISAALIIVLGSLLTVSILLYPIWFILNTVLYKRTKGAIYFISYVIHRKEFAKWHKEKNPDVNSGEIKNKDF